MRAGEGRAIAYLGVLAFSRSRSHNVLNLKGCLVSHGLSSRKKARREVVLVNMQYSPAGGKVGWMEGQR